jgi:hypothetical protein
MKNVLIVSACLLLCGVAVAEPSTFVEIALVDGGENGRNGSADEFGFEATGDVGLSENWYVGGILGRFKRDSSSGDVKNTYFNAHGGYLFNVAEETGVILEGGLWFGSQDNPGDQDTDPTAIEIKAGISQALAERFNIFGTLSWVNGDLDTPQDSNLRNYIWSLGAAYAINEDVSISLKLVNGFNGVNGQDQVLRFAGRWTF